MKPSYENFLYDDIYYRNYMMPALNIPIMNNNFTNVNDGFLKGNMENNTYIPYKNMTFIKPNIISEKEKMLYEIQKMCFAAHEINLYLDTHPNDTNLIRLYNEYNLKANELTSNYEKKYGPINLSSDIGLDKTPWSWINNPWPWNE